MTFRHSDVRPGDAGWSAALARQHHDVYHLAEYFAFATEWQEPGDAHAFVAEDDGAQAFIPYIVRRVPVDDEAVLDATVARGFPGPLFSVRSGQAGADFAAKAIDAFVETLRDHGVVSAYLLTYPLSATPFEALRRAGAVRPVTTTVSVDLTRSIDELWSQTRQNHRRSINKGRRAGYTVRIDDQWARFDEFVALHGETMERLDAAPGWRHPGAYFEALRAALGDRIFLCLVEQGDVLAGAAILTEVDGICLYLTSGVAEAHASASPMKLLIAFAERWAKERGDRTLHLGGAPPAASDLIHFKLGFSPLSHTVYSWRIVVEPSRYAALTRRWATAAGVDPDAVDDAYFPAYRRPIPATAVA